MPRAFLGSFSSLGGGHVLTVPRKWTKKEHDWVFGLFRKGYSLEQICESTGRSLASIQNKLRRLGKKRNVYNEAHLEEKYDINRKYAGIVNPGSVLDLYCGERSFWKNSGLCEKVFSNDADRKIEADCHERAEMLVHRLYYEGMKYDVVDIDPFGSPYDCLDLSIKMARKGIIVTFGELSHKRLKRLDYVRTHYGISNLRDFTAKKMIREVKRIAKRNKKRATLKFVGEWRGIARAWFTLRDVKVTEQWSRMKRPAISA